ncbi:flavin reductase family protein [Conexibacter woesei]|uniref:Flavin reductase domain protein FMN-binding protein n=1 Tax=Conexibacter woesei (strain DSM 14684 / CCUG 47730 / CIP 108061 / JCM 11494 / NBRC 100937 / ID131577) TaxID=469383 RepID=D3FAS1_CONWI|nr:flavin reductase family protein [Conexibacter woesei]ADB51234.1 flavin reductase domain protein FMN-binding protein [Conexibacter woesei DSM 14684]
MILDPLELERAQLNALIGGLVYPRPIALVSTVSEDGVRNLAPFSFFNAFCFHPSPVLGIGPGSRRGINKDSLANARATGEFVVNLVSAELAETANRCSGELPPDVDEWTIEGIEALPSECVRPERVAISPASFECRVLQIVDLGPAEQPSNSLVIGRVERIHVADAALDGLTPLPEVLDLVGRLGGDGWTYTRDRFDLRRPDGRTVAELDRPVRGPASR